MGAQRRTGSPRHGRRLTLTLLGDFQVRLGPAPPLCLRTRKAEALLAYCALPPGPPHSRHKLAALLWGDLSPQQARGRLRETLFVLRRALASADPPCLQLGRETLALDADAVDVDAVAFERLVEEGGPEALARAADLYGGDLLEGLAFRGALFEDWLMGERERLRELALDALAKLLAHQRVAGPAEAALQTALRLIALDPLQEAVHRALMRLYAQLDRRGAALRQYQLCVGILQRELGVEPEAGTRQLYQEILRRRPSREPAAGTLRGTSGPGPLPVPPAIAAPPAPLIGRDGEMARLREALARARAGAGQLMVIVGEAGVGKSRLISEIAGEASPGDARLLLGRCYESDQILPFGPWVDALRTSGVTVDRPVLEVLAPPWRAELARLVPEVEVPGLPVAGDNQLRLFESVARLIEALAARQAVLLMLEDLHWADEMTLRLLAFVTRRIPPWRLLLVVTAREEELPEASAADRALQELAAQAHAGRLALRPLSRADTRRLIQAVARAGSDARGRAKWEEQVWAASEGNPFVAVETIRALQEGSLRPEAGTLPLPERVRELIAGRLGRLSDRARELAAVAAVIGREFDFPLLERATDRDEHAAEGVEELVRRHVLRGVGERFDFSHHRVQAVVYDQMLPLQRRLRHRRVGAALETLHTGDLEPHYLALSLHFREGEVWDKAIEYLRRAGEAASARSAYREAVNANEQALAALDRLPESPATMIDGIDLRLRLGIALAALADYARALDTLRPAETTATALKDARRLGLVLEQQCVNLRLLGSHSQAIEAGQRGLAVAQSHGDLALAAWTRLRLSQAHYAVGELTQAADLLRPIVDAPPEDPEHQLLRAQAGTWLAMALGPLGQFDEAIRAGEEARSTAETADDPWAMIGALAGLALVYSDQGDFRRVFRLADRGLALAQHWNVSDWAWVLVGVLSWAYGLAGQIDQAISYAERAVKIAPSGHRAAHVARLGNAYRLAGRSDDALKSAQQALELSRRQKERRTEAMTLRLIGELAARPESPDIATVEKCYEEALALALAFGFRPLVAHCHLDFGKLYRGTGDRHQAHEHLATATTMYREMDMRFWLEQAEAEMRALA